jgi:hypothetical protein
MSRLHFVRSLNHADPYSSSLIDGGANGVASIDAISSPLNQANQITYTGHCGGPIVDPQLSLHQYANYGKDILFIRLPSSVLFGTLVLDTPRSVVPPTSYYWTATIPSRSASTWTAREPRVG